MDLPALAGVFLRRPLRPFPRSARSSNSPWTLLSNEVLDWTFTVVLSELRHFLVFVENRRKVENKYNFKAIGFLKFLSKSGEDPGAGSGVHPKIPEPLPLAG